MRNTGSAPIPVMDAPVLQAKMVQAENLTRSLDKVLAELEGGLDRLANQPPRAVAAGGSTGDASVNGQVKPSIEGQLSIHLNSLDGLVNHAGELLQRLNRLV